MAYALGEADTRFIMSVCAKYGLDIVEEAYEITLSEFSKNKVEKVGAFFNSKVRALGEEKLDDLETQT